MIDVLDEMARKAVLDEMARKAVLDEMARKAVLDVYSLWSVHGAKEWAIDGNATPLPRRMREVVVDAAGRVAERMRELEALRRSPV